MPIGRSGASGSSCCDSVAVVLCVQRATVVVPGSRRDVAEHEGVAVDELPDVDVDWGRETWAVINEGVELAALTAWIDAGG